MVRKCNLNVIIKCCQAKCLRKKFSENVLLICPVTDVPMNVFYRVEFEMSLFHLVSTRTHVISRRKENINITLFVNAVLNRIFQNRLQCIRGENHCNIKYNA